MRPVRERILETLQPIVASPEHVFIDGMRINEVAAELSSAPLPPWDNELQFLGTPEETAQYYFFLDSTNFCFWGRKGESRWEYQIDGEWRGGYYAYARALKDACLRDKRLFDADYLRAMPLEDFKQIFQGRNELLLLEKRHAIIQENFSILAREFGGSALQLVQSAGGDIDAVIETLLVHFPTFRDEVAWQGNRILFLKRAQIFPSDISFTGIDALAFRNLERLTVFADYRLPQLLEALSVLRYSDELDGEIRAEVQIPVGSQKEIEIRASTIVAVERIREAIEQEGRKVTTQELDWILWVKSQEVAFTKPHHKTLTIFY